MGCFKRPAETLGRRGEQMLIKTQLTLLSILILVYFKINANFETIDLTKLQMIYQQTTEIDFELEQSLQNSNLENKDPHLTPNMLTENYDKNAQDKEKISKALFIQQNISNINETPVKTTSKNVISIEELEKNITQFYPNYSCPPKESMQKIKRIDESEVWHLIQKHPLDIKFSNPKVDISELLMKNALKHSGYIIYKTPKKPQTVVIIAENIMLESKKHAKKYKKSSRKSLKKAFNEWYLVKKESFLG